MKITIAPKSLANFSADALVILVPEDKLWPEEKLVDRLFLAGQIAVLRTSKDFTGEANKTRVLYTPGKPVTRVVLAGLGKSGSLNPEKIREAVAAVLGELKRLPVKKAGLLLSRLPGLTAETAVQAVTEAAFLSSYDFPYYKQTKKNRASLEEVQIVLGSSSVARSVARGLNAGQALAEAVIAARDLGNHPSNVATPRHLADHALRLARVNPKIKVRILGKNEIAREKMGAVLAVAKGSEEEPKFIILEYQGHKRGPRVVLAGKGITFDSGGISIKPSEKMEEMKYDMAGAATVMGVIQAAAALRLPLILTGLIPATENLLSGRASKPGDIIQSRSGKTIEIISTDAEGRLVLADALDYAKKYRPDLVIDFATLTGAIVVALGDDLIGAFANREQLLSKLKAAAAVTGEWLWPMPLHKNYEDLIKSDFADLRNLAAVSKYGDAINAALFLQNFVDYPWIHLDIAGVAWATREKPYRPKGATGTGVRLAVEFLKNFRR